MKGQYFSFDAIIASVIFILALVALLSYWHSVKSFLDYQDDPLSRDAVRLSNLLFTPPTPEAWSCTETGMEKLGFAISWDDRRVNSSILKCAETQAAASQTWLREKLGADANTGVFLKVTNLNDGTITPIGEDVPPSPAPANVVNIRRLATVVNSTTGETTLASFELTLYK
ncbi:hypothetical protein H0O00_02135 [Candidatus Micrarchaeota archaeon]|nr:hypothetical protein [Candidatus Micrarchaeota archaeon]